MWLENQVQGLGEASGLFAVLGHWDVCFFFLFLELGPFIARSEEE